MACSAFDSFAFATEYLSKDLYKRALPRGYMLNLVPREDYPMDAGFVLTSYTFGRIAPYVDERAWVAIGNSQPNGIGTCGQTWNDVTGGWNSRTSSPEGLDLRGETICETDMIFGHMTDEFLEGYIEAITKSSRMEIENQLLMKYMYTVNLSVQANNNFQQYAPGANVPVSTSDLVQQQLDQVAVELNLEGANTPNSNGWIDLGMSGPRYSLLIGQEASNRILLNNAEFREDIRFADMGKGVDGDSRATLLRNLGSTLAIKNFRHMITVIPPRFTWDAGTQKYIRVNTFNPIAATKGTVAEISAAYKSAPFEGAVVLNPFVISEYVVRPKSVAAGVSWPYKTYFGEWKWKVGGREISDDPACYDPMDTLGRHFAQYKHAIKKILPQYGRLIIFKNCAGQNFVDTACS